MTWLRLFMSDYLVRSHILHYWQSAWPGRALRPTPQSNLIFVERALRPIRKNGARCKLETTLPLRQGLKPLSDYSESEQKRSKIKIVGTRLV